MERRIQALRKSMNEQGVPGFLVSSNANRYYLSGFTGSAGSVLVTPESAYLITDFRYTQQGQEQAPHLQVMQAGFQSLQDIGKLLDKEGVKRVGFEEQHVTYHMVERRLKEELPQVEWVPIKDMVEKLRYFKDEMEKEAIIKAVDLADAAFDHICGFIQPGMEEREVALELEMFFRRNGASESAFTTIVASGERGALPHGVASSKAIEKGDLVTIDMGARLNHYVSDLTRTVAVGTPDDRGKEIYSIVLEAQLAALNGMKAGITGKEADQLARDVIEKAGYGKNFGHGLGHGLGIEVHESPRLSPQGEDRLEVGMVFTVEPGIYLPGWGGVRIEDDVVIEVDGVKILTQAPKELIQL